eukprot:TRINITY_DN3196_c0_g1_i2.p1 TRINITY_DN3196_c0_g1~~TRINITY_DN3196_c0_g1_i2.p1  ORF type:complete len:103 (+),score=11.39 TRINITY_DN3196_c0_g1_i2:341-649(+)
MYAKHGIYSVDHRYKAAHFPNQKTNIQESRLYRSRRLINMIIGRWTKIYIPSLKHSSFRSFCVASPQLPSFLVYQTSLLELNFDETGLVSFDVVQTFDTTPK